MHAQRCCPCGYLSTGVDPRQHEPAAGSDTARGRRGDTETRRRGERTCRFRIAAAARAFDTMRLVAYNRARWVRIAERGVITRAMSKNEGDKERARRQKRKLER